MNAELNTGKTIQVFSIHTFELLFWQMWGKLYELCTKLTK